MKDFIEYLVEYADGFEIKSSESNTTSYYVKYKLAWIEIEDVKQWEHYPLLLQRAIEGINTKEVVDIVQTRSNVLVSWWDFDSEGAYFELDPKNTNEAKEEALKYIWEQSE